jgi:hypothetical protein
MGREKLGGRAGEGKKFSRLFPIVPDLLRKNFGENCRGGGGILLEQQKNFGMYYNFK